MQLYLVHLWRAAAAAASSVAAAAQVSRREHQVVHDPVELEALHAPGGRVRHGEEGGQVKRGVQGAVRGECRHGNDNVSVLKRVD
jgi:hypothetical protein